MDTNVMEQTKAITLTTNAVCDPAYNLHTLCICRFVIVIIVVVVSRAALQQLLYETRRQLLELRLRDAILMRYVVDR